MSRVSNILDRARDSLGDPDKKRFSDARLLRLLSEAQEQVIVATKQPQRKVRAQNIPGSPYVELENCLSITRVEYNNIALPFTTMAELDKVDPQWQTRTGEPYKVVYNLRKPTTLRLWPFFDYATYPELHSYGLASVIAVQADLYGAAASIPGSVVNGSAVYGVVTTIDVPDYILTVYYVEKPQPLTTLTDELLVNDIFDTALKQYVVGFALRDNMDTQNRAVAQEELAAASASLQVALRTVRLDSASANYDTVYNGGF